MSLIGAAILYGGIKTQFSYERSGIVKTIRVPFFEADKVKQFEEEVLKHLSGYQDDRNVRVQTEKTIAQSKDNTKAIVNAVNGDKTGQNESVDRKTKFCPNCGS